MKIAVTGASGFIGGNLSRYLHERGHNLIVLVRSHEKAQPLNEIGIVTRVADVTDQDSLKQAFQDVEAVIHLAALFNHPEASWSDYYRVNVEGTKNVLEAAMHSNVRRVVHCSTVGVATGSGNPPYSEQTPYSPPAWDKYETTKCEGEKVALDFHHRQGLEVVVIRPAQVYGPGDRSKAKFYRMVKKGIIANPGKTLKHLIYIDDLCRAFEMAVLSDKTAGEAFIIGGEKAITLTELVNIVARELSVSPPRIVLPTPQIAWLCTATETFCNILNLKPPLFRRSMDFFTKSVEFDVSKAQNVLGFRSEVDVPSGVARTASWYKENGLL
jgi:nucleoside-diphosphate-sugar epimerase